MDKDLAKYIKESKKRVQIILKETEQHQRNFDKTLKELRAGLR